MKVFHNSILILHILSLGLLFTYRFSLQKFVDAPQNRCTGFVLFGNYTHLRSYAQKAKMQCGTLYSGDETHYGPSPSLSKYSY